MSYDRLERELDVRLDKLKRDGRTVVDEFQPSSRSFHRFPMSYMDPLRDRVAECGLRSSRQSITLDDFATDELDALLKIDKDDGYKEIVKDHGVLYWTVEQVESCQKQTDQNTYSLGLEHEPYEGNYAHGNIMTHRDGQEKVWSKGSKKQFRHKLTKLANDHRQIVFIPAS